MKTLKLSLCLTIAGLNFNAQAMQDRSPEEIRRNVWNAMLEYNRDLESGVRAFDKKKVKNSRNGKLYSIQNNDFTNYMQNVRDLHAIVAPMVKHNRYPSPDEFVEITNKYQAIKIQAKSINNKLNSI